MKLLNERLSGYSYLPRRMSIWQTLGFESGDVKKYQAIITPIDIAGERLGTLFMLQMRRSSMILMILSSASMVRPWSVWK